MKNIDTRYKYQTLSRQEKPLKATIAVSLLVNIGVIWLACSSIVGG